MHQSESVIVDGREDVSCLRGNAAHVCESHQRLRDEMADQTQVVIFDSLFPRPDHLKLGSNQLSISLLQTCRQSGQWHVRVVLAGIPCKWSGRDVSIWRACQTRTGREVESETVTCTTLHLDSKSDLVSGHQSAHCIASSWP